MTRQRNFEMSLVLIPAQTTLRLLSSPCNSSACDRLSVYLSSVSNPQLSNKIDVNLSLLLILIEQRRSSTSDAEACTSRTTLGFRKS